MPTDWTAVRLGDLVRFHKGVSYQGKYLDMPGPKLLGLGTIVPGGGSKVETAREYSGPLKTHHRIRPGEIYVALTDLTQEGAVLGSPAIVPQDTEDEFAVTHHVARLEVVETKKLDTRFLYYLLRSPEARAHMRAMATGTTVRAVAPRDAENLIVELPPFGQQEAIAAVLGALDDKIELNRRMSETLEAIAEQLFHDWFVEYGPVRAKAADGAPYYPDWLWSLFPESLNSDGRPTGWIRMRVGEIGTVVTGKTPSTKKQENFGHHVPFVTIPDMRGQVFVHVTSRSLSITGAASQANKALPPGAICVSCIATPGLVAMTTQPSQTNQQINSVIPFNTDETYFWFMALRDMGNTILQHGSGGSVLPNLSRGRFIELTTEAASPELRRTFHSLTESMFTAIRAQGSEVSTLIDLRDTLLPKLVSGELRVPEAEQLVTEVA